MPSACAVVMTSIHWSTVMRPRAMTSRTSWSRISADVPGSVPSPASFSSARYSLIEQRRSARSRTAPPRARSAWMCMSGSARLMRAREIDVVAAVQLRRQPGLDADLGARRDPTPPRAPHDLLDGQEVALLLAVVAAERAEAAVLDADVGEVDVAVDDVGDDVADLAPAQLVGGEGQRRAGRGPRASGQRDARRRPRPRRRRGRGRGSRAHVAARPSRAIGVRGYQRRQCSCDRPSRGRRRRPAPPTRGAQRARRGTRRASAYSG